jgi:hypothetical protein
MSKEEQLIDLAIEAIEEFREAIELWKSYHFGKITMENGEIIREPFRVEAIGKEVEEEKKKDTEI